MNQGYNGCPCLVDTFSYPACSLRTSILAPLLFFDVDRVNPPYPYVILFVGGCPYLAPNSCKVPHDYVSSPQPSCRFGVTYLFPCNIACFWTIPGTMPEIMLAYCINLLKDRLRKYEDLTPTHTNRHQYNIV